MNRVRDEELTIQLQKGELRGILMVPEGAGGLVIFSHGSGSSRLSSRNRYVAEKLQETGLATLLFDLLTKEEDEEYEARFDIPLLTERLKAAVKWAGEQPNIPINLQKGIFGASTGAASALVAAAALGEEISAVVCHGGRPDMAMEILNEVKAPTLLIVGGNDDAVIQLNRLAYEKMTCERKLEIIPGATHLFEEPGALAEVANLSARWFLEHFKRRKYV